MSKTLIFKGIMMKSLPIVCLCLALSACSTAKNTDKPETELPISKIVMYQSGIGYVERTAQVDGNELVLHIRPDQINDILKSLTVIDRKNGRPVSITLPVDKSTLDSLSQIPDQVKAGGIRSLLEAFRGAHVKIHAKKGKAEGRIVGVEENIILNDNGNSEIVPTVTLLTQKDELKVFKIKDITTVNLFDKSLTDGLDKSLNISLNEGDWKQIELRIRMDSQQKRDIALSYLIAMPTWKPAYRLILDKDDKGTLQGWAIISNVTGADWNQIAFSLVSGQPMSFTYDLYTPQFIARPDLTSLSETKAAAPVITQSAYGSTPKEAPKAAGMSKNNALRKLAPKADLKAFNQESMESYDAADSNDLGMDSAMEMEDAVMASARAMGMEEEVMASARAITSDEMASSFSQLASNTQLGSFDEYVINSKLSIPDGNTALVNLIQNTVNARETRMFKPTNFVDFEQYAKGWRQSESYQTIELKNDLAVGLDSGPITIFKDGALIGEGYLTRTAQDATAYITFAREGRLEAVIVDSISSETKHLNSIKNGLCQYDAVKRSTRTFEFTSHIKQDVRTLFQIPRFQSWTPVDFPKDTVTNDNAYVLTVDVPANAKTSLTLSMTRTDQFTTQTPMKYQPHNDCVEAMKTALASNEVPEDKLNAFTQVIADHDLLRTNATKTQSLRERRREITSDQASLSNTLHSLEKIRTANAESLKRQLVARQQTNERALVNITTDLYTLQVEKGEAELRIQTNLQNFEYTRNLPGQRPAQN